MTDEDLAYFWSRFVTRNPQYRNADPKSMYAHEYSAWRAHLDAELQAGRAAAETEERVLSRKRQAGESKAEWALRTGRV